MNTNLIYSPQKIKNITFSESGFITALTENLRLRRENLSHLRNIIALERQLNEYKRKELVGMGISPLRVAQ